MKERRVCYVKVPKFRKFPIIGAQAMVIKPLSVRKSKFFIALICILLFALGTFSTDFLPQPFSFFFQLFRRPVLWRISWGVVLIVTLFFFVLSVFEHIRPFIIFDKECFCCPLSWYIEEHELIHLKGVSNEYDVEDENIRRNGKRLFQILREPIQLCHDCYFRLHQSIMRELDKEGG
ncbi:MAG: hypothetical protein J7L07_00030 [Candidatus Odinarchaeota archaeon]|nr:hypothetical protein [Candidatus Odinarchaeota archaeon]